MLKNIISISGKIPCWYNFYLSKRTCNYWIIITGKNTGLGLGLNGMWFDKKSTQMQKNRDSKILRQFLSIIRFKKIRIYF